MNAKVEETYRHKEKTGEFLRKEKTGKPKGYNQKRWHRM